MANVKVMISLNPNLLEALDKVAKAEMKNRSVKVTEILRNDPDVWNELEELEEVKNHV